MLFYCGLREALLETVSQHLRSLFAEGSETRQRGVFLHQLHQRWKEPMSVMTYLHPTPSPSD